MKTEAGISSLDGLLEDAFYSNTDYWPLYRVMRESLLSTISRGSASLV